MVFEFHILKKFSIVLCMFYQTLQGSCWTDILNKKKKKSTHALNWVCLDAVALSLPSHSFSFDDTDFFILRTPKHNSNFNGVLQLSFTLELWRAIGGLWAALPLEAVFPSTHSVAVRLSEKKNGAESKYPQTASQGWLDCWYFGPFA